MAQITIDPRFFESALRDYANPSEALVREAIQNGIDAAGSTKVEFGCFEANGKLVFSFANDGEAMDRATLVGKFLALGATGKETTNSVGGFGEAKRLLILPHDSYEIVTGGLQVAGSGGSYEIAEFGWHARGTRTEIVVSPLERYGERYFTAAKLEAAARRWAWYTQWPGKILWNGEELETGLRKGSPRREFSWGRVYTNRKASNVVVVRAGGVPMFFKHTTFDGVVVVELTKPSTEVLTANRDGLRWPHYGDLDEFLATLAADRRSALSEPKREYVVYRGGRLRAADEEDAPGDDGEGGATPEPEALVAVAAAVLAFRDRLVEDRLNRPSRAAEAPRPVADDEKTPGGSTEEAEAAVPASPFAHGFVVANGSGRKIPKQWRPESLGAKGRRLAEAWAKVCLAAAETVGFRRAFQVGFNFSAAADGEVESALFVDDPEHGPALLVSPAAWDRAAGRWVETGVAGDHGELVSLALHEAVHATGLKAHNEDFAAALTAAYAKAWRNPRPFKAALATGKAGKAREGAA